MTDPMPYMVSKTATFTVFDSRYSGSFDDRISMRRWLRDTTKHPGGTDGNPSGTGPDQATLRTPALDQPTGVTGADRIFHINHHWCGLDPADPNDHSVLPWTESWRNHIHTGVWKYWKGNAAEILREGYARALEASMGIGPDDDPQNEDDVDRLWPIEFLWTCPHPRFEFWVTWRQHDRSPPVQQLQGTPSSADKTRGQVTVLICTPGGEEGWIKNELTRTGADAQEPDYEHPPKAPFGDHGMWVVGHETTQTRRKITSLPRASGKILTPSIYREGIGNVVTVRPSEKDGGVLKTSRMYTPAT